MTQRLPGIAAADREALARLVAADPVLGDFNTGIAGRGSRTGQVGAGTVRAPLGCFSPALEALARARGVA